MAMKTNLEFFNEFIRTLNNAGHISTMPSQTNLVKIKSHDGCYSGYALYDFMTKKTKIKNLAELADILGLNFKKNSL